MAVRGAREGHVSKPATHGRGSLTRTCETQEVSAVAHAKRSPQPFRPLKSARRELGKSNTGRALPVFVQRAST